MRTHRTDAICLTAMMLMLTPAFARAASAIMDEGQFFRHRKRPEWGIGVVIGKSGDSLVLAFDAHGSVKLDHKFVAAMLIPCRQMTFRWRVRSEIARDGVRSRARPRSAGRH